jgi:hypothetical protein
LKILRGAVVKWLTQLFAEQPFVGSNPIRASVFAKLWIPLKAAIAYGY